MNTKQGVVVEGGTVAEWGTIVMGAQACTCTFAVAESTSGFMHLPDLSPPAYGSLWIWWCFPLATLMLCSIKLLSSGRDTGGFQCLAHFVPIHSAISSQDLWLGMILSLSGKALVPCIEAMAISNLYLANWKASRMAWDGANGSESANTLSDSALISWVRICKAPELWSLWVGGRSEHWGWSGSSPFLGTGEGNAHRLLLYACKSWSWGNQYNCMISSSDQLYKIVLIVTGMWHETGCNQRIELNHARSYQCWPESPSVTALWDQAPPAQWPVLHAKPDNLAPLNWPKYALDGQCTNCASNLGSVISIHDGI